MLDLERSRHPSPAMLLSLLLAFFLQNLECGLAHYQVPSSTGFSLSRLEKGQVAVHLSSREIGDVACRFSYSSNPDLQSEEKLAVEIPSSTKPSDVWKDFTSELEKMPYCLSLTGSSDYWSYELCPKKLIKQFHSAEVYILGYFSDRDDEKFEDLFDKGDTCDAIQHRPQRKIIVRYECEQGANIRLASVIEKRVCEYEATVVSNLLCGDPSFKVFESQSKGNAQAITPSDENEDWHLSLSRGSDGSFICQAYLLADANTITFEDVSLSLINPSLSKKFACSYFSRSLGRNPSVDSEFQWRDSPSIIESSTNQTLTVSSTSDFQGHLSFLEIYCSPLEQL